MAPGVERVGIAGAGAVALACAADLCASGRSVTLWPPHGAGGHLLARGPLVAEGVVEGRFSPGVAEDAAALCAASDIVLIAVPLGGHRSVMDAMVPHLRDRHLVLVGAMASLSALYLHECLRARGCRAAVAASGTTLLTARRAAPDRVRVMVRRARLGMAALPASETPAALARCTAAFGPRFAPQAHVLETALGNTNPVAHVPLALFNWTRIERAEAWAQYQCMTPRVAAAIEALDAERHALAAAFGLALPTLAEHFAQSFGTRSERLADIAVELHAARGGPSGPIDIATRYVSEDVPFGLVFALALGRAVGMDMPATRTMVQAACLITGRDLAAGNDLLVPLGLEDATVDALMARVGA